MKKFILTVVIAIIGFTQLYAQTDEEDSGIFNHLSAGISVGTDGIGIEVAAPLTNNFAVRTGYSFMPKIKVKKTVDAGRDPAFINYSDNDASMRQDVDIEGKLNMGDFKLLFDYYPSQSGSFHLTAGAYFGKSNIVEIKNSNAFLKQSSWGTKGLELGTGADTYTLVSDNTGNMQAEVKTNSVKPYVGIGFGRAIPRKRVGVQFDLGVQFWGKPEVWGNINCVNPETGYLETSYQKVNKSRITNPNSDYQDVKDAIKTIEKFRVFPVLTLRINGRIF